MVVDADMDELPTQASAMAVADPIAGDAVAGLRETTELFDIDMNDLAGRGAFIAAHRLGRLQVTYPA